MADGAISTTGMPCTYAAMTDERLDRPTSCAPPTTACATTAPLEAFSTMRFRPAALKSPTLSAYQNGSMSSLGDAMKRIVVAFGVCAPATEPDASTAAADARPHSAAPRVTGILKQLARIEFLWNDLVPCRRIDDRLNLRRIEGQRDHRVVHLRCEVGVHTVGSHQERD